MTPVAAAGSMFQLLCFVGICMYWINKKGGPF